MSLNKRRKKYFRRIVWRRLSYEVRLPGILEPITAWRAWNVRNFGLNYYLTALSQFAGRSLWRAPFQANCFWASAFSGHGNIPSDICGCGFYGCKTLFKLLRQVYPPLTAHGDIFCAVGKVTMWGKVLEYEGGYRAEFAKPISLWVFHDQKGNLRIIQNMRQGLELEYQITPQLYPVRRREDIFRIRKDRIRILYRKDNEKNVRILTIERQNDNTYN
ncbi:MAG: hypothetical protein HYZ69_00300 [Candidatus Colwellbacteria bacterium]|nr:hypothetical protein [Candidatus Colwellbacteria bacterium]